MNITGTVTVGASIALSRVIEYLVEQILELSAEEARLDKFQRIKPKHILRAIEKDDEIKHFFDQMGIQILVAKAKKRRVMKEDEEEEHQEMNKKTQKIK